MHVSHKTVGISLALGALAAAPLAATASTGLRSPASGQVTDTLAIPQQRVVSDQGADFLSPLGLKSSFISDTTPPAAGLSVRVWNTTAGFSSDAPFTERPYTTTIGADPFVLVPDSEHRTRWFSVLPGNESAPKQNDFRYEIVNAQGNVLETGEFSVAIALNPTPITTIFRYGPHYNYRHYPTDYYGLGFATDRGRYGHYWNERRLFKNRRRFLRNNSEIYRRRTSR